MTDLELVAGLYALVAAQDARLVELDVYSLQTCRTCGATWYGRHDDPCDWCNRRLEAAQRRAHDDMLRPPDVGEDHELRQAALTHWGSELRHAVDENLVTLTEAETAVKRASGG